MYWFDFSPYFQARCFTKEVFLLQILFYFSYLTAVGLKYLGAKKAKLPPPPPNKIKLVSAITCRKDTIQNTEIAFRYYVIQAV